MRLHRLLPVAALAALPFSLPLLAASSPEPAVPTVAADDDHTPLQSAMEDMKDGQRALKRAMADPKANKVTILEQLSSMESAIMTALGERPPLPEGLGVKESALFQVGFRHQLAKTLQVLLEMHRAAWNEDGDALQAGYEALVEHKQTGHDEYRQD